ncbi:MAG: LbetaH domain-containing protein [Planctomycetota bacterium]|jgi:putative colanic acid biosynthesis acetyltransferase WcaF
MSDAPTPQPAPPPTENVARMLAAPSPRRSVWTARQKLVRGLWSTFGRLLWVLIPGARSGLIRVFGGRVGPGCRFACSVDIAVPWNIHVGRDVEVGRDVILYSLGLITLGDGVVLDDLAHLCAGTHDHTDSRFPLLRPPITIGPGTFIGIDAYIAPDVTLGADCRVWPRASVHRSFGDGVELRGNPARPTASDGEAPA